MNTSNHSSAAATMLIGLAFAAQAFVMGGCAAQTGIEDEFEDLGQVSQAVETEVSGDDETDDGARFEEMVETSSSLPRVMSTALSPHAIGTSSDKTPSTGACNGIDFGSFSYERTSDTDITIDPNWKDNNTVVIWFFAQNGTKTREINGTTYRTTILRVNRKAFKSGCSAFLRARDILSSRPDLIPLIKTAKAFRTTISRGTSGAVSSHAWGLAVDINTADNQYGVANNNPSSPNAILWREVFRPAGFRWGNDFANVGSSPDPMHFEIHVRK